MSTSTATPAQIDAEIADLNAEIAATVAKLEALKAKAEKLHAEYDARPWNRFFVVADGHIHSGSTCKGGTIGVRTLIAWRTDLSGKTIAEAVELLGEALCSFCFPEAPVALTMKPVKPVADDYCAGQGEQGLDLQMKYVSPRGTCPSCKHVVGVTSTGKVRKHKLPKA